MGRRWSWWGGLMLASSLVVSRDAGAQAALGPRDDATMLPHGVVRFSVTNRWVEYDAPFTRRAVDFDPPPSEGPALATTNVGETVTPFSLEVGLLGRLSIGVMVPYVRSRTEMAFDTSRTDGEDRFGLQPESLATLLHQYVGDVEVGARLLLVDMTRRPVSAEGPGALVRGRATIGALFRLATGLPPDPHVLFDPGTGDGQQDIEVSAFADLLAGRRFWLSVGGRYGWQLPDEPLVHIADGSPTVIPPAYSLQRVARDLGDYVELEVTPRYVINDYFAVGLHYIHRRKAADRHEGTFEIDAATTGTTDITLDASTLDRGTEEQEHRVGGGISYSTLSAFERGRAWIPLEASLFHSQSVGRPGSRRTAIRHEVRLRVYARVLGR